MRQPSCTPPSRAAYGRCNPAR